MAAVKRLVTSVDLEGRDPGPNARTMNVRALHEAVLADGQRILLLNDRGWSQTMFTVWASGPKPSDEDRRQWELDDPGVWAHETIEDVQETARSVVGPDGAYGDQTEADMEREHWEWIAQALCERGVGVTAAQLQQLPHDVELSKSVLARIGRGRAERVGQPDPSAAE
jgi:hypothetical protein